MEEIKVNQYIKSIDGLRAFAVMAVIFYHLGFQWAAGGFFGVTIFFVISGFLITNLLLNEFQKTGKISLKKFWIRRIKRLLPALFTVLFSITGYVFIFRPELMGNLKEDFIAAVFYVSNWWYIFEDQSYFEAFQSQNLLTHLWSLAIEEQFYVIWPIFLLILFHYRVQLKKIGVTIIILSLISAVLMSFLYNPIVSPDRVYYGTDTRLFSLLLGAILAIFYINTRKVPIEISKKAKFIVYNMCIVSFLALIGMVGFVSEYSSFVYYGGMFLVSVLTMLLIMSFLHPSNHLKKFFEWAPFVWIGKRSYSMYLWHFPIIILTTPQVNTGGFSWERMVFQIALTIVLTELTYQLIENPIRYGRFFINMKGRIRFSGILSAAFLIVFGFVSIYGIVQTAFTSSADNKSDQMKPVSIQSSETLNKVETEKENNVIDKKPIEDNKAQTDVTKNDKPVVTPKPVAKPLVDTKKDKVTFIGDSIIINVDAHLKNRFKNAIVDGKVGRQMWELGDVITNLKRNKQFGDVLVLSLGTNGPFRVNQLQELIDGLGKMKQIVLVNTRVPRKWESSVNQALAQVKKNNPDIILVDWYRASKNHDEYFVSDGVHLTKEGSMAYADLIYKAIINKKK